jgi:hypothetical protein
MYIHLAFVWRCSTCKKHKNERSRALPTSSVSTWAKNTYLGLVGCRLPAMESTPEANRSASSPPPYLVTQSPVVPIEFNLAGDLFARGPCRCPSAVARRPPRPSAVARRPPRPSPALRFGIRLLWPCPADSLSREWSDTVTPQSEPNSRIVHAGGAAAVLHQSNCMPSSGDHWSVHGKS